MRKKMNNIFKIILGLVFIFCSISSSAKELRQIGDYLQIAIPAYAIGRAYGLDDQEGLRQMGTGLIVNLAATQAIKKSTLQMRPDGSNRLSFPSGHTSAAFQGAAFIHKRYGWDKAWPHYIAAGMVGYSRIESNRHYWRDVIAGAALGIGVSWYLTTPRQESGLIIFHDRNSTNLLYVASF
jgi:membrane-associated phospholipid phosphatase